jgi:hypothetical protein
VFREITVSKQADHGPKRRWYQSDYFDLFIFYYRHSKRADSKADREFVGLQLCYDIRRNQRTFEWKKDSGFSHHRVNKGSDTMSDHGASVSLLEKGGDFDAHAVLGRFMREAEGLPVIVRKFVMQKFTEYGRERQQAPAAGEAAPPAAGDLSEPFTLDC